jgi:hypothetical protein
MGACTAAELGVLAQTSWRALLVSINKYEYEYKQDRLNKEILDLKFEIDQMKLENQKQLDAMFVVEIVLCIVVFLAGYATGKLL